MRAGLAAVPPEARRHRRPRRRQAPVEARTWVAVIEAVRQGADGGVPCVPVADTIKQRQRRRPPGDPRPLPAPGRPDPSGVPARAAGRHTPAEARRPTTPPWSRRSGGKVVNVAGEPGNLKVTNPLDFPGRSRWPRPGRGRLRPWPPCHGSTPRAATGEPPRRAGLRHPPFQRRPGAPAGARRACRIRGGA